MKNYRFSLFSRIVAIVAVMGTLLFSATIAFAGGNGATSFTQTFHNATDTFVDVIPCLGVPGTITLTYNGVFHVTVNKAGDLWATGTETGSLIAVPLDTSLPTYTGHFTAWFGTSDNNQNSVDHSTFSIRATGSDGSTITFHDTAHMSTNANGVILSFDKPSCGL